MSTGIHFVSMTLSTGVRRWYVYAWRGGPKILTVDGPKPKLTPQLMELATGARKKNKDLAEGKRLKDQIALYKASPEFTGNAASTQANYCTWLDRIETEFGDTTLRMWTSREMRGDVLDWRDRWAHQPRSADEGTKVFIRLLNWIKDRGRLHDNVLSGLGQLYEFDRSDLIWEEHHFTSFRAHASVEVMEGVELAASTGLRRSDLVMLPWSAIKEHAIIWETSKSKGKALVVVPLLPETRELLDRIKQRHADFMAAQRPHRRKPLPETVLSNSYWRPWDRGGFGSRFNDGKQASKIDRNFHDLRGTFATRCMIAGLSDDEIARILGWTTEDVARIRTKYVNDMRAVIAIGERLKARQQGNHDD